MFPQLTQLPDLQIWLTEHVSQQEPAGLHSLPQTTPLQQVPLRHFDPPVQQLLPQTVPLHVGVYWQLPLTHFADCPALGLHWPSVQQALQVPLQSLRLPWQLYTQLPFWHLPTFPPLA